MIYQILEEPISKDELQGRSDIPQTLEEFTAEIKESKSDAKTFAIKLRDMVHTLTIYSIFISNTFKIVILYKWVGFKILLPRSLGILSFVAKMLRKFDIYYFSGYSYGTKD